MNDATPNTSHDATDRVTSRDTVPVVEAAVALGVTDGAVRARLRRGTLAGEKRGDTWVVDRAALIAALRDDAIRHDTTRTHDATSRDASGDVTSPDELTAHLQEEVAYLRDRLVEADRERDRVLRQMADERERFDVIHRTALDRIEALAASVSDETTDQIVSDVADPTMQQMQQRGIWARLRRFLTGDDARTPRRG